MQAGKSIIVKYKSPEQKDIKKKIRRRDFVKMNIKMNRRDGRSLVGHEGSKCMKFRRLRGGQGRREGKRDPASRCSPAKVASPRPTSGQTSTAPTRTPTHPPQKDSETGNYR